MNYNEFIERLLEDVNNEGFKGEIIEVKKPQSQPYEGITINGEGYNGGPVFNAKNLYEEQKKSGYSKTFQAMIDKAKKSLDEMKKAADEFTMLLKDYERAKQNMLIRMIPIEGNEEFLEEVPHKKIADLAATIVVNVDENAMATLRNCNAEMLGMSPDQLIEDLIEAGPKSFFLTSLTSILSMLSGFNILEPENDPGIYYLSYEESIFGAGLIAYPKVLEEVSERLGGSFYIIPSSIHEVLLLPASWVDMNLEISEIINMIKSINIMEVSPEEKLSDNLYFYDAGKKKFMTAEEHQRKLFSAPRKQYRREITFS